MFCKLVVSCKMQMQSSLASYNNNRVIRLGRNNANLIYILSVVFLFLHLQTDNQLAKHCTSGVCVVIVITCSAKVKSFNVSRG